MATIPNVPYSAIPQGAPGQTDPLLYPFPALDPITVIDLVGPGATNRQHNETYKGATTLLVRTNLFNQSFNALPGIFLQMDGSHQWGNGGAGGAPLDMNQSVTGVNGKIINLYPGLVGTDAANMNNLSAGLALKVSKTGDSMSGALDMGGNYIHNVTTPAAGSDAVNKTYTDSADALAYILDGSRALTGEMNAGGHDITQLAGAYPIGSGATAATTGNQVWGYAVPLDGSRSMTGALDLAGHFIHNVTYPAVAGDAANAQYAIDQASYYAGFRVAKTGDTMSGSLDMGGNYVHNVASPAAPTDAANKGYADTVASNATTAAEAYTNAYALLLTGGTMSGGIDMGFHVLVGLPDPVNPQDAATKNYVNVQDGIAGFDGTLTNSAPTLWDTAAWSSATAYTTGQRVTYAGNNYIAIAGGTNHQPDTSPSFWSITTDGFGDYEYSGISIASKTLYFPGISIIRVSGNVSITNSTINIGGLTAAQYADPITAKVAIRATHNTSSDGYGGSGYAPSGAGGQPGYGDVGPFLRHLFLLGIPFIGGYGIDGSSVPATEGGGCLILIVDGNVDLTGTIINASGVNGVLAGGAGGGSIIIICTGQLTGGTLHADGGGAFGAGLGGGGGGYIGILANTFGTAPTLTAYYGVNGGGAPPGSPGASDNGYNGYTEYWSRPVWEIYSILRRFAS